ncbi:MAG: hypothetical protein QW701_02975 [Candidatus Nezhaarchaeales archaeon]
MKKERCPPNSTGNRERLLQRRLKFNFKSLENLKKLGLTRPIIEAREAISALDRSSQLRILTIRSSASLLLKGKVVNVGVGECCISSTSQEVLSTLVGSCVAIVIHDFKLKMGVSSTYYSPHRSRGGTKRSKVEHVSSRQQQFHI